MVREDIFGILKTAAQRGKNLQQTAQSLVNSGYLKSEVDEAVQAFTTQGQGFQQPSPTIIQKPVPVQQSKQPAPVGQTKQVVSSYSYLPQQYSPYLQAPQFQQPIPQFYPPQQFQPQMQPYQVVQNVSAYEQNPKAKMGRTITIIMIAMLIALFGILVAVFLFKEELTSFINNL